MRIDSIVFAGKIVGLCLSLNMPVSHAVEGVVTWLDEKKRGERGAGEREGELFGGVLLEHIKAAYGRADLEVVAELLARGADVNYENYAYETSLKKAVERRDLTLIQRLINAGADPEAVDGYGKTALELARQQAVSEIVAILELAVAAKKPRAHLTLDDFIEKIK